MRKNLPDTSAFITSIIAKEVMKYKEQIKETELITKIRIIRSVKKDRIPIVQVAHAFSCHRNTITNIVNAFEKQISIADQQQLLEPHAALSYEDLMTKYSRIRNKSRKPHSHKNAATESQEQHILDLFNKEKLRVGAKRMHHLLQRRYTGRESDDEAQVTRLTPGQLKGIYKRNALTAQKVRSATGEVRHLYDYQTLGCFERLHYDVKYILDKHALPENIYKILSVKEMPKYEWNILDAKSRFRFLAYSYERPAEFGLRFLLFVIQYIRSVLVAYDVPMVVGFDNGMEFCAGSAKKEEEWNMLFSCVNASVYSYEPRFDIRKNLIERSHLSDDEELYIPRGNFMKTKQAFVQEVTDYAHYWNYERSHSGIGMHDKTPFEMIRQSGIVGAEKLMQFPLLILDDAIDQLRRCTSPIEIESFTKTNPGIMQKALSCQKTRRDIENRFFLPTDAQNVLTYYLYPK